MTKKNLLSTWILLIALTLLVVFFSLFFDGENYLATIILLISALKFLAISFYFMEMKKAHVFWKTTIIVFLLLFIGIVLIIS
ncbi:MAG: cytochrome C oxidase subunit IV family protein [Polaribacter sp.]|nr:cytochrome C oxidase subunit IV family protein [Polaribacter sp.]MDG1812056.1 cytochrome C oxidase subunit IV family protein [Polaribacter sp.]MDG1993088.1 cytochrome C oxidase subunit IV family protein [Polaribacter sp.]